LVWAQRGPAMVIKARTTPAMNAFFNYIFHELKLSGEPGAELKPARRACVVFFGNGNAVFQAQRPDEQADWSPQANAHNHPAGLSCASTSLPVLASEKL